MRKVGACERSFSDSSAFAGPRSVLPTGHSNLTFAFTLTCLSCAVGEIVIKNSTMSIQLPAIAGLENVDNEQIKTVS